MTRHHLLFCLVASKHNIKETHISHLLDTYHLGLFAKKKTHFEVLLKTMKK